MSELAPKQEVQTAPELSESVKSSELENSHNETHDQSVETLNKQDVRQELELLEQPKAPLELPFDASQEGDQPQYIDRAMKKASLKNELSHIRQKLPRPERILSSTIHQPIIRRASDISASTVARSSGLLGGGIVAFGGSLILLLSDKFFGFRYNYLLFVPLFIIGYVLALLIEAATKAAGNKKG